MNDLRDQIAEAVIGFVLPVTSVDVTILRNPEASRMADAVLALPAIADAVALAELCAPLTIEQVARALEMAAQSVDVGWFPTDDEKAIASWEAKQ